MANQSLTDTAHPMAVQTKAAVYSRVSTRHHGQNPQVQVDELRSYASRRGWLVEEYIDNGVSGSLESRASLDRLMNDARRRRFDVVLVWKLDRFARSLKHLVIALAELEALGIAFVSVSDNLDLTTPAGRLMFHVIGAMAEFERELCRERILAGQRHARAKGKHLGRPRTQVDFERARKMRLSGMSWRQIARELDVPVGTLHRVCAGTEKSRKGSEA